MAGSVWEEKGRRCCTRLRFLGDCVACVAQGFYAVCCISIPAVKYDLKRALSVCFLFIFFFLHARLPAQHIFTLSVLSYSGKVNSLKAHKYSHLRSESADSEHTLALAHKGAACSLSYQHLDPSRATDLGEKSLVWLTVSHSACWFNRRAVSRCSRLRVRSSSAPNYHLI